MQTGVAAPTPLLQGLAAARGITLPEAASLVLERHQATQEALVASEALRERCRHAIDRALTNAELAHWREQLLRHLDAPALAGLPAAPVPTTPADLQAELAVPAREIEVARLQAQLRYAVNTLRGRIDGGFDQNDGLMKHKAKMAQAVLNNDGKAPAGLDVAMLSNLASAPQPGPGRRRAAGAGHRDRGREHPAAHRAREGSVPGAHRCRPHPAGLPECQPRASSLHAPWPPLN